ncbi:MAG: hypothetical protein C0604_07870 [Clostridiales bacterium]|nr:MAG: hypothetical protein C0604_07870 [Clostridiales bacterium]
MKRTIMVAFVSILALFVVAAIGKNTVLAMNSKIVSGLEGKVYYEKRVDGVLTLFSSDANLENEVLVYSHKGNGRDSYGSYNYNILDYHFDSESGRVDFIAMHDGEWSSFAIEDGESEVVLTGSFDFSEKSSETVFETDYISKTSGDRTLSTERGSIYLTENGKKTCIKKFYGIYDGKFTGYGAVGFSPDGDHMIYGSMGHLTPLGTMIEGLLTGDVGEKFIMEMATGKSAKYVDAQNIQWVSERD